MPELELEGIRYVVHPDVYGPSDDTSLLLAGIRVEPGQRFLEIGCGTGLVAIEAARQGARVVATDVNPTAVHLTRENARRNHVAVAALMADLDRGLRMERFDAVAFNPPYLPTGPGENVPGPLNRALDGGPDGRRVLDRFLASLSVRGPRTVWLVASSLQSPPFGLGRELRLNYGARSVRRKKLSFETLMLYELSQGEPARDP